MRHKCLLVIVKEWLKSVLNYRSYPQNKTGYPFLDHPVEDNDSDDQPVTPRDVVAIAGKQLDSLTSAFASIRENVYCVPQHIYSRTPRIQISKT